jgi:flavin-dependent dehydrogenase
MTTGDGREVDVVVVGGGLAGAAMAIRVARQGLAVDVVEQSSGWRWHACGVFASAATARELRSLGMAEDVLESVARPVPAMRVETPRGAVLRLCYGASGEGAAGAFGFDRRHLDRALLDLASAAGARVVSGHRIVDVEPSDGRDPGVVRALGPSGPMTIRTRLIVGADGIRSVVARSVGAARAARLGRRVGLSWHIDDPSGDRAHDARMVVLDGAYCGLAPVPGGRLNVGIVLSGRGRLADLAARGAAAVGAEILAQAFRDDGTWPSDHAPLTRDAITGAFPLGHRVVRRAGQGWMLIGDAAGFLDPFTGEGLHRALVSARLAARTVSEASEPGANPAAYDRAMRSRFAAKDTVSLLVQAFLARPALFEYAARRLARRERVRETLGLVLADLAPATRALDPRFVAAMLAP